MIEVDHYRKGASSDDIEERNKARGDRLGGSEQIKPEGVGKGGGQTVECDEKSGSVSWTGITGQPLLAIRDANAPAGRGSGVLVRVREEAEREDSSGHNTVLTKPRLDRGAAFLTLR